jgi:hypothetical protein
MCTSIRYDFTFTIPSLLLYWVYMFRTSSNQLYSLQCLLTWSWFHLHVGPPGRVGNSQLPQPCTTLIIGPKASWNGLTCWLSEAHFKCKLVGEGSWTFIMLQLSTLTMPPFMTMFMHFTIIYFRAGSTTNKNKNCCKLYVFMLIYRLSHWDKLPDIISVGPTYNFSPIINSYNHLQKVQEEFVNPYPIPRVIHSTLYLVEVLFKTGHCT